MGLKVNETEEKISATEREQESRINAKIAETKAELVRWIIGAGFLQTALITGLLVKLSAGI